MAFRATHWYLVEARGVCTLLFGCFVLAWPGIDTILLARAFAVFVLLDGVINVRAALIPPPAGYERWAAYAVLGIGSILTWITIVLGRGMPLPNILRIVAIWAIFVGIIQIVSTLRLRRQMIAQVLLVTVGTASILFGTLLVSSSEAGASHRIRWVGLFGLALGLQRVALAFRFRTPAVHPQRAQGTHSR
jgi:uncharacterized membrane protein HdeD (DUF308 family)